MLDMNRPPLLWDIMLPPVDNLITALQREHNALIFKGRYLLKEFVAASHNTRTEILKYKAVKRSKYLKHESKI
jgi:hypothetical protein